MELCGNICFSGFYSDDLTCLRCRVGVKGCRMFSLSYRFPRTLECSPLSRATRLDLENKSFAKKKIRKSMSSLYCYLLYFNLAQIVLRNVIGDF